jgi:hypothetical protein
LLVFAAGCGKFDTKMRLLAKQIFLKKPDSARR